MAAETHNAREVAVSRYVPEAENPCVVSVCVRMRRLYAVGSSQHAPVARPTEAHESGATRE